MQLELSLLAKVDPGFIIMIVLVIFGWIAKLAKSAQQQPPALGGRGPKANVNRDPAVQNEIDQFLEDVLGPNKGGAERQRERKPKPPERPRRKSSDRPAAGSPPPKPVVAKKSGSVRDRHIEGQVGSHVQGYMAPQVGGHLEQNVPRLESTLGKEMDREAAAALAASSVGGVRSPAAHRIFSLLGDTEGIKQAILINEILQPPLSLRNRRDS